MFKNFKKLFLNDDPYSPKNIKKEALNDKFIVIKSEETIQLFIVSKRILGDYVKSNKFGNDKDKILDNLKLSYTLIFDNIAKIRELLIKSGYYVQMEILEMDLISLKNIIYNHIELIRAKNEYMESYDYLYHFTCTYSVLMNDMLNNLNQLKAKVIHSNVYYNYSDKYIENLYLANKIYSLYVSYNPENEIKSNAGYPVR